ncbi:lysostaphin resistance A-like protein [Nocardiopsis coralliicola]
MTPPRVPGRSDGPDGGAGGVGGGFADGPARPPGDGQGGTGAFGTQGGPGGASPVWSGPAPEPPLPSVASAPAGSPYHLLARNAWNSWWRPIAGTVLIGVPAVVLIVGLAMAAAIAGAVRGVDVSDPVALATEMPLITLGTTLLGLALVLPLVPFAARFVQRRPAGSTSSVAGRFRWRWALRCAGAAAVAIAACYAADAGLAAATGGAIDEAVLGAGAQPAALSVFLPAALLILALVPFQAAAEEYVFRGWLLQAFGAYFRTPWPAIVLGSVVFMALHGYTGWGAAWICLWAVSLGWITVRTGGLEAAVAMHVLHNVVGMLIAAALGEAGAVLDQGAVPGEAVVGLGVQTVVFLVLIEAMVRRGAVQTVSGRAPRPRAG